MKTILVIVPRQDYSFGPTYGEDFFVNCFIANIKNFVKQNNIRFQFESKQHITFKSFRFIAVSSKSKKLNKILTKYVSQPNTEIVSLETNVIDSNREIYKLYEEKIEFPFYKQKNMNVQRFLSDIFAELLNDVEITKYFADEFNSKVKDVTFKSLQYNTSLTSFQKDRIFDTKDEALNYLLSLNKMKIERTESTIKHEQHQLENYKKIEERLKNDLESKE